MPEDAFKVRRQLALEFFSLKLSTDNASIFDIIDGIRVHPGDAHKLELFTKALAEVVVDAAEVSIVRATKVTLTDEAIQAAEGQLITYEPVKDLAGVIAAALNVLGFEIVAGQ